MTTYLQAQRQHRAVREAAAQDSARACSIWNAIVGIGDPDRGIGEATRDTRPGEYAALLATDSIAAAYAFQLLVRVSDRGSDTAVRDRARAAWADFRKRAEQTAETAAHFGWDLSAAWRELRGTDLPAGRMLEIEAIGRLAGRMAESLGGAAARKVPGMAGEVYSVELGRDVGRLLPSESAQLCDAALEVPVLHRLATGRAHQYATRGDARRSRGPLVILIDESHSMREEPARERWSKAAAVALARVAHAEKRSVTVVHFSKSTEVQRVISTDPASVIRMIRTFLGGGTDIAAALRAAALEVRDLAKRGDHGADVLLVTDGEDPQTEEQAAACRALSVLGARIWTIGVEHTVAADSPLRTGATRYVEVRGGQLDHAGSVSALAGAL